MTAPARRRGLLVALPVIGLVFALAGCSAPGAGSAAKGADQPDITAKVTAADVKKGGDTTLTMWADVAEKPLMQKLVPAYEKAYPNVDVKITYKSFDDLTATVVNAANSSNAPDLFEGNIGYAVDGALVKGGLVRPLDDVAKVYGWTSGTGRRRSPRPAGTRVARPSAPAPSTACRRSARCRASTTTSRRPRPSACSRRRPSTTSRRTWRRRRPR